MKLITCLFLAVMTVTSQAQANFASAAWERIILLMNGVKGDSAEAAALGLDRNLYSTVYNGGFNGKITADLVLSKGEIPKVVFQKNEVRLIIEEVQIGKAELEALKLAGGKSGEKAVVIEVFTAEKNRLASELNTVKEEIAVVDTAIASNQKHHNEVVSWLGDKRARTAALEKQATDLQTQRQILVEKFAGISLQIKSHAESSISTVAGETTIIRYVVENVRRDYRPFVEATNRLITQASKDAVKIGQPKDASVTTIMIDQSLVDAKALLEFEHSLLHIVAQ